MQVDRLEEIVTVFEEKIITGESDEKCEERVTEERETGRLNRPARNSFVGVLQFARHVRARHDT